jgi:hypothetical protein
MSTPASADDGLVDAGGGIVGGAGADGGALVCSPPSFDAGMHFSIGTGSEVRQKPPAQLMPVGQSLLFRHVN